MSIIPNYVPSPYKTLNIQLTVKNASHALDFYNRAFEAEVLSVFKDPNGIIRHAEIKIADTVIMLSEEVEGESASPQTLGGTSVTLQLYTGDCEGFFEGAVGAGAEVISPIEKKFYGDRAGKLRDPFGFEWVISTHMEDLTARELQQRFQNQFNYTNQQL